jgi:polyhydroxybutyrate depolymerase
MASACPADTKIKAGDTNGTIMVGSMMREYILHVPASYDGKTPMPLVIDWHPLFGTASGHRGTSGYAELGDKEGFVTLYPNGINNAWNIGPCCTQSRDVDDLGFAKALVERMRTEACIDMRRVYAAGYSMGGGMSHYLACNAADLFAAVAPAAFDLLQEDEEPCKPARPITVIAQRGTADPIVPYEGGASSPPTPYTLPPIHFRGAVGTMKRWAELNMCTDQPADVGMGCQTYKQCASGVEVTLCTSPGGGHVTGNPDIGWATLKRFSL